MIYNQSVGSMVLGVLLKNATLIANPKYPLSKSDFDPIKFHKGIFVAIARLASQGVVECSKIEIENAIKDNKALYNICVDNDYFDFINTCKTLANPDSYDMWYNKLRKFSLLRELKEQGYNIDNWYDEIEEREKDETDISEILATVENLGSKLRSKYDTNYVRSEMYAGEDTENLLTYFEKEPAFGALLTSGYQTTIYRGWCRSHLILRGAAAGQGKSRLAIADLCSVGAKQIWDEDWNDFVDNPNYQGSTFFIHTEMLTRENINPIFLSCISGVNNSAILDGKLTLEEKKRVLKAGEILEKSRCRLIYMPDFNSKRLEQKIGECVRNDGCSYGVFDYIQLNSSFSQEYKESMGSSIRPDMAIAGLSTNLKEIAEEMNIGLMTMCQLNNAYQDRNFCDASCLAGARAMQDKIDCGSVMIPAKENAKSYKKIEPYILKKGFSKDGIVPNMCEHIFKSRYRSIEADKIKIWSYFDKNKLRRKDFFCTNENDEIINIPITKGEK